MNKNPVRKAMFLFLLKLKTNSNTEKTNNNRSNPKNIADLNTNQINTKVALISDKIGAIF